MSLIGSMGVGSCGPRSSMWLSLCLILLGLCKVLFLPLAPTAMGRRRVEEIDRFRS